MQGAAASGVESMQGINRTVFRSVFLTTFFLLVPATLAMTYVAFTQFEGAAQRLIIFGAIAYVTLVFGVTIVGNVPMNERLAKLTANSEERLKYWKTYGLNWTRWNHIRTIGSIVTSGSYLFAMLSLTRV